MLPLIQIKGIREGLLVTLGEGQWEDVWQAFLDEIETQGDFLQGGKIVLDVESHILKAATMGNVRDTLSDRGLSLWAILSSSPTTEQNAQTLGLATRIHERQPVIQVESKSEDDLSDEGILVKKTLRSGNNVNYPGHITLIGDVNPGAEIIAGGDIVVWGRLRGMVHAGAEGDESAVVCALDLSPTQLRIADQIAIPPKERGKPHPEIAYIHNNKVIADPWEPQGKK